jgi:hypothetical protein
MPQTADVASKAATGLAGYVHEKNSEDDGIGGWTAAIAHADRVGAAIKLDVDLGIDSFPLDELHR